MEDCVTEIQNFLPPLDLNPEDGSNREDEEETKDASVSPSKPEEVKKKQDLDVEAEHKGKDSSAKGGLINNLISTLVSPMSPKTGNKATEHERSENGVFSNSQEDDEEVIDEKTKRVKTEDVADDNNGGGGSIIHNIVSHLPPSIPDDAVPTADEASILINSLVRD